MKKLGMIAERKKSLILWSLNDVEKKILIASVETFYDERLLTYQQMKIEFQEFPSQQDRNHLKKDPNSVHLFILQVMGKCQLARVEPKLFVSFQAVTRVIS